MLTLYDILVLLSYIIDVCYFRSLFILGHCSWVLCVLTTNTKVEVWIYVLALRCSNSIANGINNASLSVFHRKKHTQRANRLCRAVKDDKGHKA